MRYYELGNQTSCLPPGSPSREERREALSGARRRFPSFQHFPTCPHPAPQAWRHSELYSDKLKQCSSTQIILIPVLKNGKPVGNARFAENILQPAAAKQPLAAPGEDQLLLLLGVVLQERRREAEVERREETFQVQH